MTRIFVDASGVISGINLPLDKINVPDTKFAIDEFCDVDADVDGVDFDFSDFLVGFFTWGSLLFKFFLFNFLRDSSLRIPVLDFGPADDSMAGSLET